ncbi:hypothetical protein [Niveispirillum sp. BGYR6]|uniref:hypothetical protein n=1 Tax=Niveispirillum sp. BGYR6 TaxID=2971249 RepID=UPI0022B94351|nr:hypothetical protein [Niveispirillum sp. BGYR6]MDG5493819.1 hypothetical protein [Niveispirillum sp. BGYR6]
MKEMRTLGFTERESIQAIIDLMRKQRLPIPVGQVVALELVEEPVSATLIIEDNDGKRTPIQRSAAELAASLVNFCIERKVRLPSTGDKFVEVIAGSLNLVIFMAEVPGGRGKMVRRKSNPTVSL